MNNICTGEHVGTHIDAPKHRIVPGAKQWYIHEIPLENLFGPVVVIDSREGLRNTPDNRYGVTIDDIQRHEDEHGEIPQRAIVFTCTGWSQYFSDPDRYWGSNNTYLRKPPGFHYPAWTREAARWLIQKRKIRGIGVETPACDVPGIKGGPVHAELLGQNVWCLENVNKICEVPPRGATAYILPIKVRGGSAVPVRVMTTWGRDDEVNQVYDLASTWKPNYFTFALLFLCMLLS